MPVNFTFGENIAASFDRGQQRKLQAEELQRLIEKDAFNKEIQRLAMKMDQKRMDLDQRKFDHEVVTDALAKDIKDREFTQSLMSELFGQEMDERQMSLREQQFEEQKKQLQTEMGQDQELHALDVEKLQAQIANYQSLVDSRSDKGSGINQGAVNIELQSRQNSANRINEELLELREMKNIVESTGTIPKGLSEDPIDPREAISALTKTIGEREGELSAINSRLDELKELSGTIQGNPKELQSKRDKIQSQISELQKQQDLIYSSPAATGSAPLEKMAGIANQIIQLRQQLELIDSKLASDKPAPKTVDDLLQ